MATLSLPGISALPSLPSTSIASVLDLLFEPSQELHKLLIPLVQSATFSSYSELIENVRHKLLSVQAAATTDADIKASLLSILGSHPRLGAKKVDSAQSASEQAQLKASDGSSEAEKLARLNTEYEQKFPGLRYVVFVNGRSRDVIMENMKARIARGDFAKEELEAIQAMCDIASDRAGKLSKASL